MELPRSDGEALENAEACRLCRGGPAADPRRWSLFQEDLGSKLVSIAAVQIQENDGLPTMVCTNCRDMVFMFYNFKCQVEKVDHDLRQALLMKQSAAHWPTLPIVKPVENISSLETMASCLQKNIISSSMAIQDDQAADNHEQFIFEISNSCNIESELCKNGNQVQFNNSIVTGSVEDNSNSSSIPMNNSSSVGAAATFGNQQNNLNTQNGSKNLAQESANQSDDEKPLILRTKRHKCRHCIKSFANLTLLEKHAVVHKKPTEVVYVCYLCDEQFNSVDKVKEHASTSHDVIRNLKKAIENTKTQRVNGSTRIDLNNKVEITCKVCFQQFTSNSVFTNHMKCHQNSKNKLLNEQNVQKHIESSFNLNGALKAQNNNTNSSGANSYRDSTDISDDDFSDDDRNKDEPEGNFECNQCGKIVSTLRNLKRHLLTHSSLGYNCALCDKEFFSTKELKTHLQLKHKIDSEESLDENKIVPKKKRKKNRPHKCPLCPKAFAQAQSLANHEERHRRAQDVHKRYLCEVCSKCFAQSGSLVAHMRTHTGVKPYVCNVCNRAFTKSTYLQLHLRTHSGEKPYVCQYCKRAFARANTLARHLTMHTGEAKYKCQICLKSFRRLTSLNEHTYTHTGQRPYACKICSKRYNNAGSLYAHTKKCKATAMKQSQQNSVESFDENFTLDESLAESLAEPLIEPMVEPEQTSEPIVTLQPTENNIIPQNENIPMPQVLIIADDKFNESLLGEVLTTDHATYQFMIANVQEKPMANTNIFEPFVFQEQDMYNMNQKQFKQPYYGLYPSM